MMATHECGHVLHAYATGGSISRVEVPLLGFSRTDVAPNPHPLVVAWGGAMWGVCLPLGMLVVAHFMATRFEFLARFFAGFCLIANGAYLAGGAWLAAGDAADLLRFGASRWQLIAFGIPAIAGGLWLWNGLGPDFGLGPHKTAVDRRAAWTAFAALVVTVVILVAAAQI
jgi:hypothetical protein